MFGSGTGICGMSLRTISRRIGEIEEIKPDIAPVVCVEHLRLQFETRPEQCGAPGNAEIQPVIGGQATIVVFRDQYIVPIRIER